VVRDVWAVGEAYEAYVGRWSRRVAGVFVPRLRVPAGRRWLDVGCGTGALTGAVLATADPARVCGVDPSAGFLASARAAVADPRAAFVRADARELPVAGGSVDVVVSGLALNFVPDPARAAAEIRRVLAPGGTAAAYVWDYAGGMAMMRLFWDAAAAVDPAAAAYDEGPRFPVCTRPGLAALWQGAGLRDVRVEPVEIPTVFRDFADFWTPFLGGQGAAPAYLASLPAGHRAAIEARLRDRLPAGPIALSARAWSVRGTAVWQA